MIKVEKGMVSIMGHMGTLMAETEVLVHAMAKNIREAAKEAELDEAERLKIFADSLTDAVFLDDYELAHKKLDRIKSEMGEVSEEVQNAMDALMELIEGKEEDDGNAV